MTLHKLIGLYSVTLLGDLVLGTKTMWVSLNFGRMMPLFRKSKTVLVTKLPTKGQNFWKKMGGIHQGQELSMDTSILELYASHMCEIP